MTADLHELIDHAAGWRMPIRVRWPNEALAEVTFAEIPMLTIQKVSISQKLNDACSHGQFSSVDGLNHWYIPKLAMQQIARKSDETDPERLVRWHLPEPEDLSVDADFVTAFCNEKTTFEFLRNPKVMMRVWVQLQQFMLRWMVTEGRPLNLMFGRLDAFPVRANWKNALIGRIFKVGSKYPARYLEGKFEFFRQSILVNTEWMTAWDRSTRTMRWSAEFRPSKKFHEAAREREMERKKNHRWKTNYLGQIIQALTDPAILERLYENIVAYAKETNFPFAIFPDGSDRSHPPKGWQPIHLSSEWYPSSIVTDAQLREWEGSEMVPEDASVPSVSDLQSPAENVRLPGDEMDAAGED